MHFSLWLMSSNHCISYNIFWVINLNKLLRKSTLSFLYSKLIANTFVVYIYSLFSLYAIIFRKIALFSLITWSYASKSEYLLNALIYFMYTCLFSSLIVYFVKLHSNLVMLGYIMTISISQQTLLT